VIPGADDAGNLTLGQLPPGDPVGAYSEPLFDQIGRTVHRLYFGGLLVLALVGVVVSRRYWREVSLLWFVQISMTVVYVAFHPSTRYRVPTDPMLFIFSAYAVVWAYLKGYFTMNTRFRLVLILLGGLLVIAVFTFPLWRPLFVNEVVDEPFPGLPADMQEKFRTLPPDQQEAFRQMRTENEAMAMDTVRAVLGGDQQVAEDMPINENPVLVASGSLSALTRFMAQAARRPSIVCPMTVSSYASRTSARPTPRPALETFCHATRSRSRADLGDDYRDLGRLKGNVGNQNYEIPTDLDIGQYHSSVIYCDPFQVVFSTATLE
jgi:hypothetical protein